MNPPKATDLDYIHFLIAAQMVFSCTEAANSQPELPKAPAHDAFTRLLQRQPPDTAALWREVEPRVRPSEGILVLDDTTLDKPYARKIELVTRHWSGKHKRVVQGINLQTLLWSDGVAHLPCDCRVYDKPHDPQGGRTKNEHFRAMLEEAQERGFAPRYVLFDSWYGALENLKRIAGYGWHFLTRLKSNRLVNPDRTSNRPVCEVEVPTEGRPVHLKGFGWVRLFRTLAPDGEAEHWISNDLQLSVEQRDQLEHQSWGIETYHRQIKQHCGIERAQCRSARGQINHLLFSLRAFVRLEAHRLRTGTSLHEAKLSIIRDAVRDYLAQPTYTLASTA